jgi:hypothetical protein
MNDKEASEEVEEGAVYSVRVRRSEVVAATILGGREAELKRGAIGVTNSTTHLSYD